MDKKEPDTLFRRLVRFKKWEIFKIPGKWLYRVGMVVPADLPWHPGYTVYATKGPIRGKSNARELAKRLNHHAGAALEQTTPNNP